MSFNSRPSNWYDLDYDQQRQWERDKRAFDDAEYERDQAREDAERAQRNAARARDEMRRQQAAMAEESEIMASEYRDEINALVRQVNALANAARHALFLLGGEADKAFAHEPKETDKTKTVQELREALLMLEDE